MGKGSTKVVRFVGLDVHAASIAVAVAEKIRFAINSDAARVGGRGITASVGVATALDGVATPRELVDAADHALYEAKTHGRDRVAQADEGSLRLTIQGATRKLPDLFAGQTIAVTASSTTRRLPTTTRSTLRTSFSRVDWIPLSERSATGSPGRAASNSRHLRART